jgi:hypothetical protein
MKDLPLVANQLKTNTPKVKNQTSLAIKAQKEVSEAPFGHQRQKGVMDIWESGSHGGLSILHT